MKSIKKNLFYTTTYQILYIVTPIVTTPYVSRVLGAEGIGEYAFAYSVALYFTMFIRLGVMTYGNRAIASVRDNRVLMSKVFCEIQILQVLSGLLFTSVYCFWVDLFAPNKTISYMLLLFVISATVDITWLYYGIEDFVVTTLRDIIVRITIVACVFLFVKTREDLWIYALIQGAGYLLGYIISWPRTKKYIIFSKPDLKSVWSRIKPNVILFIPTIAVSLYKTMDKIMLGAMTSSSELGFYESSEKIISVPTALITALGIVMLPRMTYLFSKQLDEEEVKEIIDKSLMFSVFVSTILCFGIMSVSKEFVPLFFGEGFEKCIDIFCWLLPSCIFLAFAQVLKTQYIMPLKLDKLFIISCFGGAFVNLTTNYVLIPRFASVGAAFATLMAEATVCVIQSIYIWKQIDIKHSIIKSCPFVISGLCMFAFSNLFTEIIENVWIELFSKIIICGLCYFVVLGMIYFGLKSFRKVVAKGI